MACKIKKDYIYLIWKSNSSVRYHVGTLYKNGGYEFEYCDEVNEAIEDGFVPLVAFPNIDEKYKSSNLFPTFTSRLPDRKRKDIDEILRKYGLNEYDAYEYLKKSGARLPIDRLEFVDPFRL